MIASCCSRRLRRLYIQTLAALVMAAVGGQGCQLAFKNAK